MAKSKRPDTKRIVNSKARFNYEILERFEAGIALVGTEVKSIRAGHASLDESFARIDRGEMFLYSCHIKPYEKGNQNNHEPLRPRKLLLHRREIHRLLTKVTQRGLTLVPLKIYFNQRGLAKVELALVKGKTHRDKREDIKKRDHERDMARAMGR
ncbi:MAG: SsrA-binding protein SmpB [Phycisphaerae bacterium]|nr:SsrA-binding protein SmpB [Phycisphaerae bacterium]